MPEPNKGQRVAQKILAIMKDVTRVEKDGYNIIQKYQYVSEGGMLEAIRGKIIEHGLVVIPTQLSCLSQHYTFTGKEGNPRDVIMTETCTEYTIIDTDSGDSLTVKFFGQGMDSGDKAVYKATTGANKYFLMKTFMIPTGDDPEDEKAPKRTTSKPAAKPPQESPGQVKPATDAQIAKIKSLLSEKNFDGNLKLYERATLLIAEHESGDNILPISKASTIIGELIKL